MLPSAATIWVMLLIRNDPTGHMVTPLAVNPYRAYKTEISCTVNMDNLNRASEVWEQGEMKRTHRSDIAGPVYRCESVILFPK